MFSCVNVVVWFSHRFPRPGLSLIKRIANDGKSKKGEGSGNGDNDDDDASNIAVTIERPSMNSRKISASIIVKRPVTGIHFSSFSVENTP